jgi:hypothetical protein
MTYSMRIWIGYKSVVIGMTYMCKNNHNRTKKSCNLLEYQNQSNILIYKLLSNQQMTGCIYNFFLHSTPVCTAAWACVLVVTLFRFRLCCRFLGILTCPKDNRCLFKFPAIDLITIVLEEARELKHEHFSSKRCNAGASWRPWMTKSHAIMDKMQK